MLDWHSLDSHQHRLVTGVLLTVPLIAALATGPYWLLILIVGSAAGVGLWELQGMLFVDPLPRSWQALFLAAGLLMPLGAALGGFAGLHCALFLSLFSGFAALLVFSPLDPSGLPRIARFALGWLYVPYLLSYVLVIGRLPEGTRWIFFILLVNAADDIAAFYCGRSFGRRKLYPAVSPKKTVEGAVGGLLASLIVGVLYGALLLRGVSTWELVGVSGALAVAGQTGDLVESMIKRISGRKDSSNLLPGHGGMLDRLDSLLFAIPVTCYFVMLKDSGLL